MKTKLHIYHLLSAFLLLGAFLPVTAQIPQIINYQGKIAVGVTPFTGSGQFRFALVNGTGSASYWSNDGTSTAGSQPTAAVALPVVNGLYVVPMGDATLPNMTPIPNSAFTNSDVRVRVWFNDGVNGSQLLSPDQRITSVGYAMVSGTVTDGAITPAKLAPGAAAANLAASGGGAVPAGGVILSDFGNTNLLSNGYIALGGYGVLTAPEYRDNNLAYLSGQGWDYAGSSAVWAGGNRVIFWGGFKYVSGPAFTFTSSGKIYTDHYLGDTAGDGAPSPRSYHTAVWTGTEMIIWGGLNSDGNALSDGKRYNPSSNTWTAMADAPFARSSPAAVWTGTEMLVWGGVNENGNVPISTPNTGAYYNPANNTWRPFNPINPPAARYRHGAVWTGAEMIVLGGKLNDNDTNWDNDFFCSTIAKYNLASNTWSEINTSSPVGSVVSAVWTGSKINYIEESSGYAFGYSYYPAINSFQYLTTLFSGGNNNESYFRMVSIRDGYNEA